MPDRVGIRIGNQSSASAATLSEPFDYAVANGFDAFEWFPDKPRSGAGWDTLDVSPALRAHVRDVARTHGMRLSVHAHCTINPTQSADDPRLLRNIELAQDLGASLLTIPLHPEMGMLNYAKAVLPPLQWAVASGVKLAIENTPESTPGHFDGLFAALEGLNPPELAHIGMCLDIGHANLCATTPNDTLAFMDRLPSHVPIIHLHVHENWGDSDSHLPLFTGPSGRNDEVVRGFLRRLCQRHYSGSLILEQWPQPPSLLNQARDRLLEMLEAMERDGASAAGSAQPEADGQFDRRERSSAPSNETDPMKGESYGS